MVRSPAMSQRRAPAVAPTRAEIDQTIAMLLKLAPAPRLRMLERLRKSSDRRIRGLIRAAVREIRFAERRGCTAALIDAHKNAGEPVGVRGMSRGRGRVRIGDDVGTIPTRRITPAIAVDLEDRFDRMTVFEATICPDPPSLTGLQMIALRERYLGRRGRDARAS